MSPTDPDHSTTRQSTDGAPVALVTGAAQRIGLCVARTLSASGYHVVLHANGSLDKAEAVAKELSRGGPACMAVGANLREPPAIQSMVRQVHDRFSRIDALVNTAAIWKPRQLEEVTPEDVREHFEVNALGTFLCCQHVGRVMVGQQQGGAIVNFVDWAVSRPYVDYAAYFPSKGAIPAMTRSLAVELAARNPRVRVNAVLPGPILLPDDMPHEQRQAVVAGTLVKREGQAEDMADAVLFLLRNDFVTGVCLPVDGGRSIYSGDVRAYDGREC